jgi:hypothetical protein
MTRRPLSDHGQIQLPYLADPLIHLSLEKHFPTACAGKWLVIDLTQSLVTLLSRSSTSTLPVRIRCHQAFSSDALRLLLTLLRFPEICPYAYLLAAFQVPLSLLITMLIEAPDPLPMTFYQLAENAKDLLQGVGGQRRERHLRHLRRVMTEVMARTKHLGFTIRSLRTVGYRLQPFFTQQDIL